MRRMNVKRWVSLCLAAVLLAVAIPVTAAPQPAFVVSEATGKPGDTVTLTVSIQNNPGIVGLRLNVAYDTKVLELKQAAGGAFTGITFGPLTNVPFVTSWVDAIHPDNKTNGVVVTLTFVIKPNAPAGKSTVSVSYLSEDVFNLAWESIVFNTVPGGVTVTGGTTAPTGSPNGNGGNSGNSGNSGGNAVTTTPPRHSVTESDDTDRGLGFLFTIPAAGVKKTPTGAPDLSGATITYRGSTCPLLGMGTLLASAPAVGGNPDKMVRSAPGVTDVPTTVLWDAAAATCSYTVRLMNIPDSAKGRTVYARPYYVVNYQGKSTVVYGAVDATTYQKNRL